MVRNSMNVIKDNNTIENNGIISRNAISLSSHGLVIQNIVHVITLHHDVTIHT